MKKILIIGKDGQVGWELQRSLATLGDIIACDRQKADLANSKGLINLIREIKPNIIVNAGAYTAVDKAETEQDLALQINGVAPGVLAEEAKRLNAILIHYSTDYVFNGQSQTPYREDSPTSPLNIYGHSKLKGEQAMQAVGGQYIILRTSWVYGMRGKNFLLTMLKLAKEREQLKIVNDQIGAPTWSRLIAQGTSQILQQCLDMTQDNAWGAYHLTSSGKTSWCHFAEAIFQLAAQNPGIRIPKIIGIPSIEYPLPAKRPSYSVLANDKLSRIFNFSLPSWEKGLELCLL